MRVLVTGGAGFIGSHLTQALVAQGHQVHIVDNLSHGKRSNVPAGATLTVADVRSEEAVVEVKAFRPEGVVHLAAQMDVRISVANPGLDADINVVGMVRMLGAAADAGASVFVFASSGGAIYGEQDVFPCDESHPIRSDSPYGISKRCGELYLDYYARKRGLRGVALRYSNVYGPGQDPEGEAGVVAIFAQKMLNQQTPVIFGDGGQTRDYVHVRDVVAANLAALANPAAKGAYNIGTGVETTVTQLAQHLARALGYQGAPRHEAPRDGEQRRSVLNYGLAQQQLGWSPQIDVETGLTETARWFASR